MDSFNESLNLVWTYVRLHPLATICAPLFAIFIRRSVSDYHQWLDLGPGGMPYNLKGYIIVRVLGLWASADTKSSSCYLPSRSSKSSAAPKQLSYLESKSVPIREGQPPIVSKWIGPVRQTSGAASSELIQTLDEMAGEVVKKRDSSVFKAPSEQEGGHSGGIFVHKKSGERIEVYHYHHSDGSAHATLAPNDARMVLDRGWGERHVLSGQLPTAKLRGRIPLTYVMIYAPRSEEEVELHRSVAIAAVNWAVEQ